MKALFLTAIGMLVLLIIAAIVVIVIMNQKYQACLSTESGACPKFSCGGGTKASRG
jgi:hypothetical protein